MVKNEPSAGDSGALTETFSPKGSWRDRAPEREHVFLFGVLCRVQYVSTKPCMKLHCVGGTTLKGCVQNSIDPRHCYYCQLPAPRFYELWYLLYGPKRPFLNLKMIWEEKTNDENKLGDSFFLQPKDCRGNRQCADLIPSPGCPVFRQDVFHTKPLCCVCHYTEMPSEVSILPSPIHPGCVGVGVGVERRGS